MAERLTSYDELVEIIDALPLMVRETRRARGLSQRAAAKQLRFSFSTISRIENGEDYVIDNLRSVLRWLDQRADGGDERRD